MYPDVRHLQIRVSEVVAAYNLDGAIGNHLLFALDVLDSLAMQPAGGNTFYQTTQLLNLVYFIDNPALYIIGQRFHADIATFPIQALLVVFLGDGFPFNDASDTTQVITLREDPRFQRLGEAQQQVALAEFEVLWRSGRLTPNTALALGEDGHFTVVELTADAREQAIARAAGLKTPDAQICVR